MTRIDDRETRLGYGEWPSWYKKPVVAKGGPGSGNFGHAGRPGEVGGSAPGEGGTSDSGNHTRTLSNTDGTTDHRRPSERRLNETRAALRGLDRERVVVFRPDGHVEEYIGEETHVSLPPREAFDYTNATMVHNHPSAEVSFSVGDLATAVNRNLQSIEAVTDKGTYVVERKGKTWPTDFPDAIAEINSTLYRRDMLTSKKSARDLAIEHQNERMDLLAKKYHKEIAYQFKPRS